MVAIRRDLTYVAHQVPHNYDNEYVSLRIKRGQFTFRQRLGIGSSYQITWCASAFQSNFGLLLIGLFNFSKCTISCIYLPYTRTRYLR